MPSADNVATYFQSPNFDWQQQNPLPAVYLTPPAFDWQPQNPLPAVYMESPAFRWPERSGLGIIYFYQRVFSSGLNVWCYYTTTNGVNPTPLSGDTIPNWTGSIVAFELITTSAL